MTQNQTSSLSDSKNQINYFINEFSEFQGIVKKSIQHQEERISMLQQKTNSWNRPVLSAHIEADVPHKKAFNAYLRSGDDDGFVDLC